MSNRDRWLNIIDAISPQMPEALDSVVEDGPLPPKGRLLFPTASAEPAPAYEFDDEETITFGARITKDTPDRLALAMTLAQMALEKGAEAIILSHVDDPLLDRFGFRVERVSGETDEERAASEAQLVRFWNIVFVI